MIHANEKTAVAFADALDRDDFSRAETYLDSHCIYHIGESTLQGPKAICGLYEQNMLEGRKRLDKLEWGKSKVDVLDDGGCIIQFTDFLTHKGASHTYRCKQRLEFGKNFKITNIVHLTDETEEARLQEFYKMVGLK